MRLLAKNQFLPVFKTAGVYGGLNIVRQLIPFLLLPVLTHYLTPSEYGTLAMFMVLISFVYIWTGLNLDAAVGREYFEREDIDFPCYVWNCFIFSSFAAVTLSVVLSLFVEPLSRLTGVPPALWWVTIFIAYTRIASQYLLIIWQSGMHAFKYGTFQISQIVMDVALTLYFLIVLKMGIDGRIWALALSSLIFAIVAAFFLYKERWVKFSFNLKYMKSALLFGIPLIPHTIGAIAISMTDRTLLMNMVGAKDTGLYFLGFQIANTISLVALAFNQAWAPWLFGNLKSDEPGAKAKIVKFTYLYYVCLIILGLLVTILSPFIYKYFIAPEYAEGIKVIPWIAAGSVLIGMYYMVGAYITYTKKTHILSWITLFTGIVNIILTYLLIKTNGYVGAAQATTISYFLAFVLTWALAARSYPMPWFKRGLS